jgi:hypothetical protein
MLPMVLNTVGTVAPAQLAFLITPPVFASATSSPNITTTDNAIYSSTYRTTRWDGELVAQRIDPVSGSVVAEVQWSSRDRLNARTAAATDTRTIYTSVSNVLTPFQWTNLDVATRAYFSNKCTLLSQCASLTLAERTLVNDGANLVAYLRGRVATWWVPDEVRFVDEIPLGARVISVVDCFTTMLTARPYRPSRTYAEAIATLRENGGSALDATLVEVFIEVLPRLEAQLHSDRARSAAARAAAANTTETDTVSALDDIAVAHRDEGVELAVHRVDAVERGLHQLDGGEFAAREQRGDFGERKTQ